MNYREPINEPQALQINGSAPTILFDERCLGTDKFPGGNCGWGFANNTGYGIYVLEMPSASDVPTFDLMIGAGTLYASGSGIAGDCQTCAVYVMLASTGTATIYPQEFGA